jgi:hypothetical protein
MYEIDFAFRCKITFLKESMLKYMYRPIVKPTMWLNGSSFVSGCMFVDQYNMANFLFCFLSLTYDAIVCSVSIVRATNSVAHGFMCVYV